MTRLLEFQGKIFWDQTEYPEIPDHQDDEFITLDSSQSKRIDLVAHDKYGDAELFWVILLANDKDLPTDFLPGETIRIPARATIDKILDQAENKS
jgi:hypothetical protein